MISKKMLSYILINKFLNQLNMLFRIRMQKFKSGRLAFTLVELLIVLTIISFISGFFFLDFKSTQLKLKT